MDDVEHVERGVPRSQQRRVRLVGALVTILTVVLIGAVTVAVFALVRLSALEDFVRVTECVREVNAEHTDAVDAVTVAKARADQLFIAALLLPPAQADAQRDPDSPLSRANRKLDKKIDKLHDLPRPDREAARRCPD